MTIDPDVRGVAQSFNLDPRPIQAIVTAEGNIVRAVQCSIPEVTTREQALRIVCRSWAHALSTYVLSDPARTRDVVALLGSRWAPVGAANDPHGLNQHWIPNVQRLLEGKA